MQKPNTIKETELLKKVVNGEQILVGTVHCSVLEGLSIRDAKSGNARQAHIEKTTILTDKDACVVENWLPDGILPENWAAPAKRGERVACLVTRAETRGGVRRLAGQLLVVTV
jgi:hypothetical protein